MSANSKLISDKLREEIAKKSLGVCDPGAKQDGGWGKCTIKKLVVILLLKSNRNCGNRTAENS